MILFVISIGLITVVSRDVNQSDSSKQSFQPSDKDLTPDQYVDPGELVGAVVHEIRDPINRLQLKLDEQESECREDLKDIQTIVERVEGVFRTDQLDCYWVPVPILFKELVIDLDQDVKNHLRFVTSVSWLYCHPYQLRLALENLIKNAMQAYRRQENSTGNIIVAVEIAGPEWCLTIEDSAGGIDPELARTINSNQSQSGTGGMGLGLLITKKIISNHGGRMVVETEQEEGSVVTLTIPMPVTEQ
ncbi:MAG: ATP-binding protein [bacterium]